MASDLMQHKLSIKSLLFTKVMPSLRSPLPIEGHETYPCTDCGDRFLLQSSYETHINRKSLIITYNCQHCHETKIFHNRCQLLSHINSHAFNATTINVNDLKMEPLPQQHFNSLTVELENQSKVAQGNTCYECKNVIKIYIGQMYKARAEHYMQFSKDPFHTCPICLFTVPTLCGLLAHMRIHLKIPPYYCPECGYQLPNRNISYPYGHDCDGFKMMRATARTRCPVENCHEIFHPSQYQSHLKSHYNMLMKCQICFETFSKQKQHTKCPNANIIVYFQCPLCSIKLYMKTQIDKHLSTHLFIDTLKDVYQCHLCKSIFTQMHFLLNHIIVRHGAVSVKNMLSKIIKMDTFKNRKKAVYRIVKRCDKCLVSFTYRCLYENIKTLPTECPYKCSSKSADNNNSQENTLPGNDIEDKFIVCFLCKNKLKEDWDVIKCHYASYHKAYKCLDLELKLKKFDKKLSCLNKKKNNTPIIKKVIKISEKMNDLIIKSHEGIIENVCRVCNYKSDDKLQLKEHIIRNHKDPCMEYQCLECGQCFAVKRSFSTHLMLEHDISDFQKYINSQPCYNELALEKRQRTSSVEEKPVNENQCNICRAQFSNPTDLEKHFRVHGMAFLMKNKNLEQ